MLKEPDETMEEFVRRCADNVETFCSDAVQGNKSDDRVVAELTGIRIALFAIAQSIAPITDAVANGLTVRRIE